MRNDSYARKPEPHEPMQASCAAAGTSDVKYHAVRYDENGGYWAACCGTGSDGITMMSHDTVPAKRITPNDRCNKAGCRKAFALADALGNY